MSGYTVAIAGATGAVGQEMLKTLENRDFPVSRLKPLASSRSVGRTVKFRGEDIPVEELTEDSFEGIELALFSAGAERSRQFAPAAVAAGTIVIDNSSAFRLYPDVPLVVPEVNPEAAQSHHGIIANPNCSTIIACVPLWPLHRAAHIRRIICATYQAVSGTGAAALKELEDQCRAWAAGEPVQAETYPHQIAFNVLAQVGKADNTGYTSEELKLLHETRKIFNDHHLSVTCTCVRVPVLRSHSEAIWIETDRRLEVSEAQEILSKAPGVVLRDDVNRNIYPQPLETSGRNDIAVGRIRKDFSCERGLCLWVAGDQLLKGAALNAVQIAEVLYNLNK